MSASMDGDRSDRLPQPVLMAWAIAAAIACTLFAITMPPADATLQWVACAVSGIASFFAFALWAERRHE